MPMEDEDEPVAGHYVRRAAEDMEEDLRVTLYCLARGLLRLVESLTAQTGKECAKGATAAPSGH